VFAQIVPLDVWIKSLRGKFAGKTKLAFALIIISFVFGSLGYGLTKLSRARKVDVKSFFLQNKSALRDIFTPIVYDTCIYRKI